jgi:hypothetical protein
MRLENSMRATVSLVFVLTCSSLPVDAQSEFDGNNWVGWHVDLRLLYFVGWVDGRSHGINAGVKAIDPAAPPDPRKDPRLTSLGSKVTVRQMVDGTDNFYANFRNRVIPVRFAADVVWDEATGRRRWTDDDLMSLRRLASPQEPSVPPGPNVPPNH